MFNRPQTNFIYKTRLVFIMITFLAFSISPTIVAKENKDKKKTIIIHTPEPDPFITIKKDTKLAQSSAVRLRNKKFADSRKGGIDVSHYQGQIDWSEVSKHGDICYAFVKATESNYYVDDFYRINMEEGKKYGIAMGSYHFFRANVSIQEQFEQMTSIVDPDMQDLVPLIDVEAANGVSASIFASRLKEFLSMVEEFYGTPPLLYTYVNFYNRYLANKGFTRYPLMIASYSGATPLLNDDNAYIMWQYTCRGRIGGIKGDVDRSKFTNGASLYDILYR